MDLAKGTVNTSLSDESVVIAQDSQTSPLPLPVNQAASIPSYCQYSSVG